MQTGFKGFCKGVFDKRESGGISSVKDWGSFIKGLFPNKAFASSLFSSAKPSAA